MNCWLAIVPYQHQARCQIIDFYQNQCMNTLLYTFEMDHVAKFVCNVLQLSEHHRQICFSGLLTHTVKLNFLCIFICICIDICILWLAQKQLQIRLAIELAMRPRSTIPPSPRSSFNFQTFKLQIANFQNQEIQLRTSLF